MCKWFPSVLTLLHVVADEGVEQAGGDAVEAQVHVPPAEVRQPARRARVPALHPRALPALPRPLPGAPGHQDAGYLHFYYVRLALHSLFLCQNILRDNQVKDALYSDNEKYFKS